MMDYPLTPPSSPSPNPVPAFASPRWATLVVLLATTLAFARLLRLVSLYAVNVFFMDQWEFNDATLFQHHGLWQMFRWQHGPHRQGLGAVVAFSIEPLFRWNSRIESFVIAFVLLAVTGCALYLKQRLFGRLELFDVCIPLILLSPLQYETVFITANFAHGPLPVLLVLLYCLSWTISNPIYRYSSILVLNFLAIHTGFGLFLGVVTPVALLADYLLRSPERPRGSLVFTASFLLSALSLALFFFHYTYQTSVDCAPDFPRSPAPFIRFLFLMLANLFAIKGTGFFPFFVGALLFSTMVSVLGVCAASLYLHRSARDPVTWTVAMLLAYSLLFSFNAAYGRSCLGPSVAQVSRYVIYLELGLLGLYLFIANLSSSPVRRLCSALLLAALLAASPIRDGDQKVMNFVASAKRNWSACYFRLEQIRECNHAVGYGVYPLPTPELKSKLDFLKQTRLNLYAPSN